MITDWQWLTRQSWLLASALALASDVQATPLATGVGVPMPSVWRLAGGFLFVVALLYGAVHVLRRYGRGVGWAPGGRSGIRALEQSRPAPGMQATLLEAAGQRVLIVESRRGVVGLLLPESDRTEISGVEKSNDRDR